MGDPYHGKFSQAYWGSDAFTGLTGWSYSLEADTADSTAASSSNHGRTRLAGFNRGTASVTTILTSAIAVVETDAQATLELLRTSLNADKGMAATAQFTGHEVGVDKNDVETITYNFRLASSASSTVTKGG